MTSEHPFHPGLTRTNTGYPAFPYIGWYWTHAELKNIERRMKRRGSVITDEALLRSAASQSISGPVNGKVFTTVRTCNHCGGQYTPTSAPQKFCSHACRKQAAKRDGRRSA